MESRIDEELVATSIRLESIVSGMIGNLSQAMENIGGILCRRTKGQVLLKLVLRKEFYIR